MSSIIRADRWQNSDGVAYNSVLQVVSTTKTDTFSSSQAAGALVDVTGLSVSITPKFVTSKILVMASVNGSVEISGIRSAVGVQLKRNGTGIGGGTAAGSRRSLIASTVANAAENGNTANVSFNYLDSPATTNSITYQIALHNFAASTATVKCNIHGVDTDATTHGRQSSTITVMEIAQ